MEVATSQFRALLARLMMLSCLVALMLAAALLLWPQVRDWQEGRLANRMVNELLHAETADSRAALRQIASLGPPAIEALVIAASSNRADIALTAREIINEQLAIWNLRQENDENFRIALPATLLAQELANRIEEFGPLGQQWSVKLALELADLAARLPPPQAAELLGNCSIILEHVPPVGPRLRTLTTENLLAAGGKFPLPVLKLPALPSEQAISNRRENASLTDVLDERSENSIDTPEIANSTPLPSVSDWKPEWSPRVPIEQALPPLVNDPVRDDPQAQVAPGALDVPSPDEMAARFEQFKALDTRSLITELGKADFFTAATIRAVLKERGFSPEELSFASKLTATDPTERLLLVDDLKVLPARTARRWLRELLSDSDADVRLKALTALATTNDPELVGVVREMSLHESDPRVSELATRIIRGTINNR